MLRLAASRIGALALSIREGAHLLWGGGLVNDTTQESSRSAGLSVLLTLCYSKHISDI